MYEISETDSQKKAPMYKIYTMKWFVGNNKEIIEPFNINSMELAKKNGFNLDDLLSPLSGFVNKEQLSAERAQNMIQENVRVLSGTKRDRIKESSAKTAETAKTSPSTKNSTAY